MLYGLGTSLPTQTIGAVDVVIGRVEDSGCRDRPAEFRQRARPRGRGVIRQQRRWPMADGGEFAP